MNFVAHDQVQWEKVVWKWYEMHKQTQMQGNENVTGKTHKLHYINTQTKLFRLGEKMLKICQSSAWLWNMSQLPN